LTLSLKAAYSQVEQRNISALPREATMSDNRRLEDNKPCEACAGMGVPMHGRAEICAACSGAGSITVFPYTPDVVERLLTSRAREFRNLGDEAEDPRQSAELFLMGARIWEALARQAVSEMRGLASDQVEVRMPGARTRLAQLVRLSCLLYTAAGLSPWPCLMAFAKSLPPTGYASIMTACRRAGARGFPHDARPGEASPGLNALRALFASGRGVSP